MILHRDVGSMVSQLTFNIKCSLTFFADFLVAMRERKRPVALPFNTPAYSDGGYAMLGMVLQRLTGMPYNEAIQKILSEPLGLDISGSVEPTGDDRNVLVVPGDPTVSSWGLDRQVLAG